MKKRWFAFIQPGWQVMRIATLLAIPPFVFLQGVALSLGQTVIIGAQNVFVLCQGLRREHMGSAMLFCAMTDMLLVPAGVLGMVQVLGERPSLARLLALADVISLLLYDVQAFQRAWCLSQLRAAVGGDGLSRCAVLTQAAAFTLLNPHVYLDTVLLVGSIGAQQASALRGWLVAGAESASLFWFVSLGFGACWLAPQFARPKTWQALDGLIGVTMLVLPTLLLYHILRGF